MNHPEIYVRRSYAQKADVFTDKEEIGKDVAILSKAEVLSTFSKKAIYSETLSSLDIKEQLPDIKFFYAEIEASETRVFDDEENDMLKDGELRYLTIKNIGESAIDITAPAGSVSSGLGGWLKSGMSVGGYTSITFRYDLNIGAWVILDYYYYEPE